MSATIRPAKGSDAAAIAAIHNQGIEERVATFETREKTPRAIRELVDEGVLVLVAELDGRVAGFAKVSPYEERSHYYAGVGEATVSVSREARRGGVGRALLEAIAVVAASTGRHKLVAKVFAGTEPSLALFERTGYRRVGTHERHAQLDGEWRDVVVVELHLVG
jgi:phosphinothricin acetyltransferase